MWHLTLTFDDGTMLDSRCAEETDALLLMELAALFENVTGLHVISPSDREAGWVRPPPGVPPLHTDN